MQKQHVSLCACRVIAEERRYYVGASTNWVDVWGLLKLLERRRPRVQYNESVCILAALHGRVPCVDRRCLIPLRVRPHFTDFMVLKQLMERGDFSFLHGYNFTTILDAGMPLCLLPQPCTLNPRPTLLLRCVHPAAPNAPCLLVASPAWCTQGRPWP